MDRLELAKAYSRLVGIRNSIETKKEVAMEEKKPEHEPYYMHVSDVLNDFEDILKKLERLTNVRLDDFRVSETERFEPQGSIGWYTGLSFLQAKVDGVLTLFKNTEDKKKIGFVSSK